MTGKCSTKVQGWKLQDWMMRHQRAGVENEGPSRYGKPNVALCNVYPPLPCIGLRSCISVRIPALPICAWVTAKWNDWYIPWRVVFFCCGIYAVFIAFCAVSFSYLSLELNECEIARLTANHVIKWSYKRRITPPIALHCIKNDMTLENTLVTIILF